MDSVQWTHSIPLNDDKDASDVNATDENAIIPDICHRHHRRCLWRIFLSCGEISSHDRLSCGEMLHMTDCHVEKALHMRNVKKIYNVEKICVQFMVFLSH